MRLKYTTDVIVVGGGTAGVTAALAAASNGARVLLAERDGALGGVGTRGGVHVYYRGSGGGVQKEIDRRTLQLQKEVGSDARGFHPEIKREIVEEMVAEAGIHVVFHALAVGVVKEGDTVVGVVLETPGETVEVRAAVTVDATGDGDVCELAGAPFVLGRDWDGILHAYSMVPKFFNEKRELAFGNFDAGWVDPTSTTDLTRGYIEGRLHLSPDELSRRGVPPLWEAGLLSISPQIGIREGRAVVGEYILQMEDLILDRRFDDVVMRCYSHHDNHAWDVANESRLARIWVDMMGLWQEAFGGDVPYRSFVPQKVDGLLIGCRAISQDRDAGMGLRMQRDMQKVGEVAGTAAALSVKTGCQPRHLDVNVLQQRLVDQSVLEPDDLSRESAPWAQPGDVKRIDRVYTPERVKRPDIINRLIDFLGTDDEGRAMWWLWQAGESAVDPLRRRIRTANRNEARGMAMVLALLGSDAGESYLLDSIRAMDDDQLPGPRSVPRWIGCVVALGELESTEAVTILSSHLGQEAKSINILHILHYFALVVDKMNTDERRAVKDSVRDLLSRETLGEEFTVAQRLMVRPGLRWSIELTSAFILNRLGEAEALAIVRRYENDEREYIKNAAKRIADRFVPTSTGVASS